MKPKRDVEIWDCYMLPFPFSAVSLCLKNTTSDVWENPYDFLQKIHFCITLLLLLDMHISGLGKTHINGKSLIEIENQKVVIL